MIKTVIFLEYIHFLATIVSFNKKQQPADRSGGIDVACTL